MATGGMLEVLNDVYDSKPHSLMFSLRCLRGPVSDVSETQVLQFAFPHNIAISCKRPENALQSTNLVLDGNAGP